MREPVPHRWAATVRVSQRNLQLACEILEDLDGAEVSAARAAGVGGRIVLEVYARDHAEAVERAKQASEWAAEKLEGRLDVRSVDPTPLPYSDEEAREQKENEETWAQIDAVLPWLVFGQRVHVSWDDEHGWHENYLVVERVIGDALVLREHFDDGAVNGAEFILNRCALAKLDPVSSCCPHGLDERRSTHYCAECARFVKAFFHGLMMRDVL